MSISDWRPFVYGGVASCVAEFGTFPIDTSKTRLQIQGGHQDGQVVATRYKGMLHALLRISHEEGIRALYQGIAPAFLRQATYGTIKFGLYYSLKNALTQDPSQQHLGVNIFCGIVAGVVSSSIANPTDVLKVRLQSGHGDFRGKRLIEVVVSLYKNEGIAGFWKGVFPTAQRAGVIVGVELPLYDFCKHYFISSQYLPDNSTNHIVSSFVASLGGAIATTPIDVVRVRLMNQKINLKALPLSAIRASSAVSSSTVRSSSSAAAALPSSVYFGTIDCFIKTVKQEGPLALYKGFVPTWLRLGPWNIIFFVTFEQLKKLY